MVSDHHINIELKTRYSFVKENAENENMPVFKKGAARWSIILGLSLSTFCSFGQEVGDFSFYNDTTYQLYETQDWPALIRLGREALSEGFDYFYMRMRLGIAYFEKGQYQLAVPHFRKALRFNSTDGIAREYLYYSLLYSGRRDEARLYAPKGKGVRLLSIFAEGGYKRSDRQTPVEDLTYTSAGFRHSLGKHLSLSHSYQYLQQGFVFFETDTLPPLNGQGPSRVVTRQIVESGRQHEYFLGGAWQLRNGWQIGSGFRQIWVQDTTNSFGEQTAVLSVRKDIPRLSLWVSGGWSNFGRQDQTHYGAGLAFYPLANTNLYYVAIGAVKAERSASQRWISQQLGFQTLPNLWIEGQYDFGEINRFIEYNGAVAFNLNDPIRRRYGGSVQYWIEARHLLLLKYLHEEKTFSADGTNYSHDTFIIGLLLNFN